MAFFEDLTKKAKSVASVAADKAKDAAELTKISGEKTWDMAGYDETLMPASITVRVLTPKLCAVSAPASMAL